MNALAKLWFMKLKAKIRNQFNRPLSAIFTILIIIFYGFIIVSALQYNEEISSVMSLDFHASIMIAIGFTALMMFMTLVQKRKALFFGEDAYYLFSGPFSREQVMKYLLSQSIMQSLLFGALSLFIMICMSSAGATLGFYVITFFVISVICLFFMMLTDYLYVLSITNAHYKKLSLFVAFGLLALVVGIFAVFLVQENFNLEGAFFTFLQAPLFNLVPFFGWGKLAIVTFYEQSYLMSGLLIALMLVCSGIVYYFFVHFKGDFFEQALEDSFALSEMMKKAKAGKNVTNEMANVREVSSSFKSGVGAIYSKQMLILKKTKGYINKNDLLVIGIYFVISMMQGFEMYYFLLMFWIFNSLQNSDMVDELKHFQIYLIPENPFKKLVALALPTFLKTTIMAFVAMVVGIVYFQVPMQTAIQNMINLLGYIMVFISGSVLCIRMLKSRTNQIMEALVRMLVMLVCAAPSFILTFNIMIDPTSFTMVKYNIILYSGLLLNFVISMLILYVCKNMLNGRELNDD